MASPLTDQPFGAAVRPAVPKLYANICGASVRTIHSVRNTVVLVSTSFISFFRFVNSYCLILSTVVSYKNSLLKLIHNLTYAESCDKGFSCAASAPPTQANRVPRRSFGLRLGPGYSQALSFAALDLVHATTHPNPVSSAFPCRPSLS